VGRLFVQVCNRHAGHRPVATGLLQTQKHPLASLRKLLDMSAPIWDGDEIVNLAGCGFTSFAPGVCLLRQ
jgi:hypothetical protein